MRIFGKSNIMYFNYHAKIKKLILEGHLIKFEFVEEYKDIKPALLLYFDNHKMMPVREYRWHEYLPMLEKQIK